MHKNKPYFIAEVSSNHHGDIERCIDFITASTDIGAQAVKFQLFKIDQLFAPEILRQSPEHRQRVKWELPKSFLPELSSASHKLGLDFSCTPFYLDAVGELDPYVDFYKIASYELLWHDLIIECAKTGKPLILSTGMAVLDEVKAARDAFFDAGGTDLTLLHCVSGYPAPIKDCNLSAINTLRQQLTSKIGWSDHSKNPDVITAAIKNYHADVIEFHIDLDKNGAEYQAGHCWLPEEIAPVISGQYTPHNVFDAVGDGIKKPSPAEIDDRQWRADPSDGLRPLKQTRQTWVPA